MAMADGGSGGAAGTTTGGAGGTGFTGTTGGNGAVDGVTEGTSGGGGGGAGGGSAGSGVFFAGSRSGNGGAGGNHGNGNAGTATLTNGTTLTGSVGLAGGNGSGPTAGGGGGGAGGYGALITGNGASSNSGTITGGNGGNGGLGALGGNIGHGGDGGVGVYFSATGTTFTNIGTVTGGNGGTAGGGSGIGAGGGGFGISGAAGLTIINSGTIIGGLGGDGTRNNAVFLTDNTSVLELRAGSNIIGDVEGFTGTLRLGGTTGATFDVSLIGVAGGTQYHEFGAFQKTGTSVWTLTGTNAATLHWTIDAGGLLANGTMANSTFTVNSGGTLGGAGTVGNATVNSGGTLGVGSINTLTVSGNLIQNAGSTFQVNVNALGGTSLVTVTGTATLGGAVSVTAFPFGTYGTTTHYTILHANGGVTGAYSGVTSNLAFLTPVLSYGLNDVFLDLNNTSAGGTSFARGAQTANQRAVGTALDQVGGSASGDFLTVINAMSVLNTSQGPAALDAISGQNYSGFQTLALQQAQIFMNGFANLAGGSSNGTRFAFAPASASSDACDFACDTTELARWGAWGGGLGGAGTVAGDSGAHGIAYNLGGAVAGLDYRFSPNFLAGVTAGYTTATLYTQGMDGRGTSDTVQMGLYGQYTEGALYLDALAGYARGDNRQQRPIVIPGLQPRTAQSRTQADQFFGQLETGYKVALGGVANPFVTPFARLQGSTWTQAGFTEWGADSLNLTVAQQTTNSLRSVLGAQLGAGFDTGWRDKLNLVLRLGWSHEYADTSRPVTASFAGAPATSFTVAGAQAPRDGAILGLAANTMIAEATSAYLRYDGDLAGDNTSHVFSAGVRITW